MSSGETEKLFQGIPLSQNGFGTCLIILGGCQNHSGNFWEFSGRKTGNVPGLPEPLQMLFADEITKLELFQNALKIILVGTGNVLSPHKYFQFERTLKNVVVNSESAFWVASWRSHLEGLLVFSPLASWRSHPWAWPINRGGGGCLKTHSFSTYTSHA